MKKYLTRLSVLLLLCIVSLGTTTALAQRHHRPRNSRYSPAPRYRHYGSGYHSHGIAPVVDAIGSVTSTVWAGAALHQFDDYSGFRFGYNAASLRASGLGGVTSDSNPGINLGFVFGWYVPGTNVIFEPGILYSMKGGKLYGPDIKTEHGFTSEEYDARLHMIEIPMVLKYEVPFPLTGLALHPFFGGYMSFGGGESDLIGFDAGIRTGVGLCMGAFYVEFAYDHGLCDMPNSSFHNFDYNPRHDEIRTRTTSLNIGFNF